MRSFLLLVVGTFLSSLCLTLLVKRQAIRWAIFDHPDEARRVHKTPLPRLGGVAIYLAMLLGWAGLVVWDTAWLSLWRLLVPATLVFLLGVVDDVVGVSERWKLLVPATSAVLLYALGFRLSALVLLPDFILALPAWLGFVLLVAWIVGVTNALNLIDGVDGLAVGVSSIAALAMLLSAWWNGQQTSLVLSAILLAALLGFLPANFSPATIFLGDSGSLWLGFLLAMLALLSTSANTGTVSLAAPVLLGLPILEAAVTLLRRWCSGQPLLPGDRGHFHHKLLDRGLTQQQVVLRLYAAAAAFALSGLLLLRANRWQAVLLALVLGVGMVVGVRSLRYAEFRRG